MMKILKKIILVLLLGFFSVVGQVEAAGLGVVFEATPLFSEAKIMPGDSVARTITVTNNNIEPEDIEIEAINVFTSGLASAINLTVTAPGETYFSGSLDQFFSASPLALGILAGTDSRTYTFTASLPAGTGNALMLKNVGFDLVIGFVGGEQVIDNPVRRSGGGGDGGIPKLRLFNEEVINVSVASSSAVVTWNSNLPASSYLVCGKVSEGPFVLSTDAPLFGYKFFVSEVDTKVVNHSLVVTDLDLVDYECRPAGRQSTTGLFTVGQPVRFGFPGPQVAGASTSSAPISIEKVPDAEAWLGRVLGDQISQWPLGGLSLGGGGLFTFKFFWLGGFSLLLLLGLYIANRKKKSS
jgi:hypothetical protein